jgi:type I restriction enzyme M protein
MQQQISTDLRPFHNVFQKLGNYKHDPAEVLDTLLEWVMWGFCPDNSLDWESGKRFTQDEHPIFYELFQQWALLMNTTVTGNKEWFDMLGTYYETHVAGKSRRDCKGQFFTPEHVCDLMVKLQSDGTRTGQTVSDPCCGSGRFLLSYHANNPGNYLIAEDIDRTCCLMTVCNFIMHGAVGEVVHHNSLAPNSWINGWTVNEHLNNPFHKLHGIPHVRKLNKDESLIINVWKRRAEEVANQKMTVDTPENLIASQNLLKPQYQQLQIF